MAKIGPVNDYYPILGILFVKLKDEDVAFPVPTTAKYMSFETAVNFRNLNYRDDLSAADAGGPASVCAFNDSAAPAETILTENSSIIKQGDRFTHMPPHNESFKDTVVMFWDDVANTGAPVNLVMCFPYSRWDLAGPGLGQPYA